MISPHIQRSLWFPFHFYFSYKYEGSSRHNSRKKIHFYNSSPYIFIKRLCSSRREERRKTIASPGRKARVSEAPKSKLAETGEIPVGVSP